MPKASRADAERWDEVRKALRLTDADDPEEGVGDTQKAEEGAAPVAGEAT